MGRFYRIEVAPVMDGRCCLWCGLARHTVRATQLVSRTSPWTHRRYSDPACDRHALPWRRAVKRQLYSTRAA
jgi:hypothetical protein